MSTIEGRPATGPALSPPSSGSAAGVETSPGAGTWEPGSEHAQKNAQAMSACREAAKPRRAPDVAKTCTG